MKNRLIYAPEDSAALRYALEEMEKRGVNITAEPSGRVTHLLLSVPCRMEGAGLKEILSQLSTDITVLGGFLHRPELAKYRCLDLLDDPVYAAKNAMITAQCAVRLAGEALPVVWEGCPVLILGWGRIGKSLGSMLKRLGAEVSVAARKPEDLAMIGALGCDAREIGRLDYILRRYRVIFNTVPASVLRRGQTELCRKDCVLVELASKPGMDGEGIIDGRGLPGKMAPESSGKLIARVALGLCAREEEGL